MRYGAGAGENPSGELSENLQFLALYVYGLLKQAFFHPNPAIPLNSTALDNIAHVSYVVNSMSPEEVVPMLYPQIYQVSNVALDENELPEVSQSRHTHFVDSCNNLSGIN